MSEEMLITKEEVPQGTTIHKEKPFVYVLSSKKRTECCDFCFKKGNLSKCSGCKYVHYCGRACQREGWTVHKSECKKLNKIVPRILPDAARLLYRLIKVLQNDGDLIKSYYTSKDYRTYRDLMSHYPNLKNDQKRMEHFSSLCGVLYEFMSPDSLPNSAELMGMYGRMCTNSFMICNQELQSLGTGMYLAASILDHSCKPNAIAFFEGTTLYIRTIEALECLDWSKIFISYIDTLASTTERQKELEECYYFLCQCEKCLEPENIAQIGGAACPNRKCNNPLDMTSIQNKDKCKECDSVISQEYIDLFDEVVALTEMHLSEMKQTAYLDVCKICLSKQKGVLYKHHIKHVKMLDLAFESAIDLGKFEEALDFGLELIEYLYIYYGKIHLLTGLLHLKLGKLLLYHNRDEEALENLKKASEILKITYGVTSSLFKQEVIPLLKQCQN